MIRRHVMRSDPKAAGAAREDIEETVGALAPIRNLGIGPHQKRDRGAPGLTAFLDWNDPEALIRA